MSSYKVKKQRVIKKLFAQLAGGLALIAFWQYLADQLSHMILASPSQTISYMVELFLDAEFWQTMLVSLTRLTIALSVACFIGFSLGVMAGRKSWLRDFLAPTRWLLMSVPPVIVVLLAMLWFGMGSSMVIFITVILLTPTVYLNTQKNIAQINSQWLELATIYQFSHYQCLRNIYIPAIAPALCATLVMVCCNGVRIVVLAEVLGSHEGIGYQLTSASSNFETAELYAWVLVSLLLVAFLELLLLKPIQHKLLHWQGENA
ncbi:ABC transporter permease [Colwellia psychrerythraea]|uniref:ABC-type transporter, integral membrane subunit n=1 Tax=Colwellia psychrerythraea TaxID=28229 RepID=A0A099KC75_COLPS|nr:ABC transporter permease subunit [Colwellia psychrerythraea]KGJ87163.1 ABC-type transporter, integral membrane subunit [Colwellia psychrerythraea]